ncbi:hypothetical protein PILCRDRAFT_11270 [Piloderma croceum F 1598]|uniref:Major facilitator superfamily (MFS) profile domain-containing protein n=1 Tax=Piloderma croceum (strain F 1598) TaxID=765440 RepID=A0A0C3BLS8_PILCF|nr:hypothetical protein PILCRDRAFT_11270 [Piloderma croceum F 1598]
MLQVAVIIGELVGRYLNDWILEFFICRNKGVHEAESRLWPCYLAIVLYVCGFVVLWASFQNKLSLGAVIMGWGIAVASIMINTVAVYAYCTDCFPNNPGKMSALSSLARAPGGFSVDYFQVPWGIQIWRFANVWSGGCHCRRTVPTRCPYLAAERKIFAGTLFDMMIVISICF